MRRGSARLLTARFHPCTPRSRREAGGQPSGAAHRADRLVVRVDDGRSRRSPRWDRRRLVELDAAGSRHGVRPWAL